MQLVPVLDLMGGQVVRGIAGRRNEYRANQSCLVQDSNPLQTACAFRECFGLTHLYVADLDAISGRQPDFRVLEELVESGFRISVDCGSVSLTTAEQLRQLDIDEIVIPLESLFDWQSVEQLIEVVPTTQLRFSIDLMRGRPMGSVGEQESIREITERVFGFGLTKFIVLDLASVGMDGGLNTHEICQSILEMNAEAKIWTGGGIRNCEDLEGLREVCEVDGVLIASALHDGKISPAEVQRLFNS